MSRDHHGNSHEADDESPHAAGGARAISAAVEPGAGLDAFFEAGSIAIFGASDDVHKIGGRPVHLLQKYGYRGTI